LAQSKIDEEGYELQVLKHHFLAKDQGLHRPIAVGLFIPICRNSVNSTMNEEKRELEHPIKLEVADEVTSIDLG